MAMLLGQCNRAESNDFGPVSNFTLEGSTKVETKTAVLPRGRNFGRKPQKGPEKILWGRENLRPNLWQINQKRAEKGPNFFVVLF
jgi:hypothetical protein